MIIKPKQHNVVKVIIWYYRYSVMRFKKRTIYIQSVYIIIFFTDILKLDMFKVCYGTNKFKERQLGIQIITLDIFCSQT